MTLHQSIRWIDGTPFVDTYERPEPTPRIPVSPYVLRALDAADNGEGLSRGRRVITCTDCGLRRRELRHGRCRRCAFVAALVAAYPPEGD